MNVSLSLSLSLSAWSNFAKTLAIIPVVGYKTTPI